MRKSITYFERPGPENTEETIRLAYERAVELGITDIVVASTHGGTALKVAEVFKDPKFNIVAVTISEGYKEEGWTMTDEERVRLKERGIKVFTGTHSLSGGVAEAFGRPSVKRRNRPDVLQVLPRYEGLRRGPPDGRRRRVDTGRQRGHSHSRHRGGS